jgi:hypothetical protein
MNKRKRAMHGRELSMNEKDYICQKTSIIKKHGLTPTN